MGKILIFCIPHNVTFSTFKFGKFQTHDISIQIHTCHTENMLSMTMIYNQKIVLFIVFSNSFNRILIVSKCLFISSRKEESEGKTIIDFAVECIPKSTNWWCNEEWKWNNNSTLYQRTGRQNLFQFPFILHRKFFEQSLSTTRCNQEFMSWGWELFLSFQCLLLFSLYKI